MLNAIWDNLIPHKYYKMEEKWLESSLTERDLVVGSDCQQNQCESSVGLEAKRANFILGCNEHSLTNWSKEMIFLLYLVLTQLHLECCVNFSAPQFKKVMMVLEFIQRSNKVGERAGEAVL